MMNPRICFENSSAVAMHSSKAAEVMFGDKSLGNGSFSVASDRVIFNSVTSPMWFLFTSMVMHAIATDETGKRYLFIQIDQDDEEDDETVIKVYLESDDLDTLFGVMNETSALNPSGEQTDDE